MRLVPTTAALLALCLLAGCSDSSSPFAPSSRAALPSESSGAQQVGFMSRNMYIGANADAVIAALISPDPNDDVPALLTAINTLQETDYPTRAAAMADEIARLRPAAVGLQEVTKLDIDLTPLGLPVVQHLDFLPVLLQDLAQRGLNYQVAAEVATITANPIPGVSLTDHDALLVDADQATVTGTPVEQNFATNIGTVAPGVNLVDGYVMAQIETAGGTYLVINAHLASGQQPGLDQIRAAQAAELVAAAGSTSPAIILGDLNDIPGSLMYNVVTGGGFTDLWRALRPGVEGLTCCHADDLSNALAQTEFDQRLDYVFARSADPSARFQGMITRTGYLPSDRIQGPDYLIWPSDHAGLFASLLTTPAAVASE